LSESAVDGASVLKMTVTPALSDIRFTHAGDVRETSVIGDFYEIPISATALSTRFHTQVWATFKSNDPQLAVDVQTRTMQADAETEQTFGALLDCVRQAGRVTPQLMTAILDAAHAHSAIPHRTHQAKRIRRLIDAAAWTEAALAIAEFDRSRAVRRITHEDGEWCCTVGSQWPVPDWLDETIVFSHELLPLAIVGALLDATRQGAAATPRATSVLRCQPRSSDAATVSCDNFA